MVIELLGDFQGRPLDEQSRLINEVVGDSSEHYVFGVDIYKYSQMDKYSQTTLPIVLDGVFFTAAGICKSLAPNLFPNDGKGKEIFGRRIGTGDGFFLVFDNPLQAIAFVVGFATVLRLFNTGGFSNKLSVGPTELSARYCITSGQVYKYGNSYYGRGIIDAARILARDKLDRFLIDRNTHNWFMRSIYGVENLRHINKNFLESCRLDGIHFGDSTESFRLFNGISRCVELKLETTRSKESEYDLFALFLETEISQASETSDIAINIGNMNTSGIGSI